MSRSMLSCAGLRYKREASAARFHTATPLTLRSLQPHARYCVTRLLSLSDFIPGQSGYSRGVRS